MHAKSLFLIGASILSSVSANPVELRACTGPNVNSATIALIKEFEGFVPSPSPDPIGLPTVGYGHLCQTTGCSEVPYSFPLTESTATQLLMSDLKSPQQTITLKTTSNVVLNANQYGALVSWAFNVGPSNVQSSTLLKRLNAGESPNTVIAEELPKWNKAGGQTLPGLTRRRAAEVALAQTPTSVKALPACS
ncbi:lysozyme [Westerdykella ornata]|uniref:Lysozyme n=1 Tax=Westerdykella ornata TaxID=318751 RepID=A0A6A6JXJ0_WESOR|nr:lysozyme [Westerdykella ornata]KAF2280783.1 lysozyme [Westerdykella ornata]